MKVLVTGGGGREHALAWRASLSPGVSKVFVAPGNAGTALEPGLENVALEPMDFTGLIAFAKREEIDLTIIGPEDPLVGGVVDHFNAAGLACLGPTRGAAQLEGSKSFAKIFLEKYGIPTAAYRVFEDPEEAVAYTANKSPPIVIKADGLAAGKGVVLAADHGEAEKTIRELLGGAGRRIVIEEFLPGEEASFIVLADGRKALAFATAQDHKAAYDGDTGPNTGGMGAYSPAPVVTPRVYRRVMEDIIEPTLAGMIEEGHPYKGFLYAGLMIDGRGNPKVIEFNCRFGDPEAQPIMLRLQTDLVSLARAALEGRLDEMEIEFDDGWALTVVLASEGYPGSYEKGKVITGLDNAGDTKVFHAGTRLEKGRVVTAGGRVLGVTTSGATASEAQARAYEAVTKIGFKGASYRRDIGYRAIARESRAPGAAAIAGAEPSAHF